MFSAVRFAEKKTGKGVSMTGAQGEGICTCKRLTQFLIIHSVCVHAWYTHTPKDHPGRVGDSCMLADYYTPHYMVIPHSILRLVDHSLVPITPKQPPYSERDYDRENFHELPIINQNQSNLDFLLLSNLNP